MVTIAILGLATAIKAMVNLDFNFSWLLPLTHGRFD